MGEFGKICKVGYAITFMKSFGQLTPSVSGQAVKTIEKIQTDLSVNGLNFEELHGKKNYYSIRVNDDYRMIAFMNGEVLLALWVDKHDAAYQWAESHYVAYDARAKALAVVCVESTASAPAPAPAAAPEKKPGKPAAREFHMLFAQFGKEKLAALGVAPDVMKSVLGVERLDELEALQDRMPAATYDALTFLAAGEDYAEVRALYEDTVAPPVPDPDPEPGAEPEPAPPAKLPDPSPNAPVAADALDRAEFEEALGSTSTGEQFLVPENKRELLLALEAPLETWRVFLHPAQRRLARKRFNGPARALGPAGTGKTVVAIHRAKYLAENVFTGPNDRILVTTFTKNLASDVRALLESICAPDAMKRIEVENFSAWAVRYAEKHGYRSKIDYDGSIAKGNWEEAIKTAGGAVSDRFPPGFFKDEYEQVVMPQGITSSLDYKRASRVGRGRPLSGKDKGELWPVFAEFRALSAEQNVKSYDELYADVAAMLADAEKRGYPYRSIIVDETQDFSLTAYRMLRAMVKKDHDDLFLVGDARQRIYGYKSSLSAAGIDIRGRGSKLRVNYRTTGEIYDFASAILEGTPFDDLDGGVDASNACVSLRHGDAPVILRARTREEERRTLLRTVEALREELGGDAELRNACLTARTTALRDEYADYLREHGVPTVAIEKRGWTNDGAPGLRVATCHRVKGIEFDYMLVAGVEDGVMPFEPDAAALDADPVARESAEKRERSLLYVAVTRAKKKVWISYAGKPSRFLAGLGAE